MNNNVKRLKKISAFLKLALLILIVFGIPLYLYFFQRDLLREFKSFDDVVEFMRGHIEYSGIIFIGAQILQIIISVIPGQVFQFAAGYLYGFLPGITLSLLGALLGTLMAFYIARILGKDAAHLVMGEERSDYYTKLLNSKKAYIITLVIYLIPGFPKDTVCYAAGISDMKFRAFILISLIGRLPAMAGSVVFGAMYMRHNYIGMAILAAVVIVIVMICAIFRKRVENLVNLIYERIK